jgi:hypothetical protein
MIRVVGLTLAADPQSTMATAGLLAATALAAKIGHDSRTNITER